MAPSLTQNGSNAKVLQFVLQCDLGFSPSKHKSQLWGGSAGNLGAV